MGEEEESGPAVYACAEENFELTTFWAGHAVVAGVSLWALCTVPASARLAHTSYALILGQSLCGGAAFGNEGAEEWQVSTFKYASLLTQTVAMPLITNQLFKMTGLSNGRNMAFSLTLAALPLIGELTLEEDNNTLVDVSILGNVASLGYLVNSNLSYHWPRVLLSITALHHFIMKPLLQRKEVTRIERVTLITLFQIIVSVFCIEEITG